MKTTKPLKRHYTQRSEAEWRSIIDEYKTSTLTQKAFCNKHGVAISGFHLWRKRFAAESRSSASSPFIEISTPDARPPFIQPEVKKTQWDIELELAQHFILRIRGT